MHFGITKLEAFAYANFLQSLVRMISSRPLSRVLNIGPEKRERREKTQGKMDYKTRPDKTKELLMTSFLERKRGEPEEIYYHSLHLLI